MRSLFKAILATVTLTAPLYANAIPITWTYDGVCTDGDCAAIPSISGTLVGDPASLGNPSALSEYILFGELTSYSFTVGGYNFSGTRGAGSYDLDAAGNIVGGSMIFANLFALDFLGVGSAHWTIFDCGLVSCSNGATGDGSYTRTTAVPEPATLSLLGLGLLAIGFARRRRV